MVKGQRVTIKEHMSVIYTTPEINEETRKPYADKHVLLHGDGGVIVEEGKKESWVKFDACRLPISVKNRYLEEI